MLFSSLLFLFCFLPVTLLIYYICPRGKKNAFKNTVIFIASIIFYAWGEPMYIFLMLFTILHNYIFALFIDKYRQSRPKAAKALIIVSIILNIGCLGFFKYCNFFISNINNLFGLGIDFLEIALPIGISFYTFQTMSYTIDVYRGITDVQKNPISFGAYVTFFPQLIAGPIVQYKTIAEQLDNRTDEYKKFGDGVKIFTVGLAKKVLLANNIGALWDTVSTLPQSEMTVVTAWLGIIAFSFQIYFDFSGYSDMAIGLGRMFGFEFSINFNYPYISQSVTEFWRRWHISLGSWFKEYIYIPLGGNRVKTWRHILNIFVVWFCTGFWHGAGWNFIIWGLYFGVLLLIEKYFLFKWLWSIPRIFRHIYLLITVIIGWVFFAIEDMGVVGRYLATMFGFGGVPFADDRAIYLLYTNAVILVILIFASMPTIPFIKQKILPKFEKPVAVITIAACVVAWFLSTASLVSGSYNPFLYFRF
ncbi:MAG: MBOAT family protein [Clostridia bacterium]|nr:MBOAT family protein [Clostridia bacterium]